MRNYSSKFFTLINIGAANGAASGRCKLETVYGSTKAELFAQGLTAGKRYALCVDLVGGERLNIGVFRADEAGRLNVKREAVGLDDAERASVVSLADEGETRGVLSSGEWRRRAVEPPAALPVPEASPQQTPQVELEQAPQPLPQPASEPTPQQTPQLAPERLPEPEPEPRKPNFESLTALARRVRKELDELSYFVQNSREGAVGGEVALDEPFDVCGRYSAAFGKRVFPFNEAEGNVGWALTSPEAMARVAPEEWARLAADRGIANSYERYGHLIIGREGRFCVLGVPVADASETLAGGYAFKPSDLGGGGSDSGRGYWLVPLNE